MAVSKLTSYQTGFVLANLLEFLTKHVNKKFKKNFKFEMQAFTGKNNLSIYCANSQKINSELDDYGFTNLSNIMKLAINVYIKDIPAPMMNYLFKYNTTDDELIEIDNFLTRNLKFKMTLQYNMKLNDIKLLTTDKSLITEEVEVSLITKPGMVAELKKVKFKIV